jgi:hypothetical protein
MEGLLTPFDWLGPFWGLTLLSILTGIFMLWVVGKTTPQKLVKKSRNKMDSAVYEIRLFIDSPKRVGLSLLRLIGSSFSYTACMLPAFVVLALPLTFMFLSLQPRHGMDPLPINEPFVVSLELADGIDGRKLVTTPSEGLEVTAPPLYVESKGEVHVRVVARKEGTLRLHFDVGGRAVEKLIVTDPNALQMAPERATGLDMFISYGSEPGLDGPITSITVEHKWKDVSVYLSRWAWWGILVMMVAAFGLRKQFNVTL